MEANCYPRKTSEDRLSNMSGFDSDSNDPNQPKRVKIFEGGFKSNEDYTYVRGRGRGKYVCEECGIRCKKPSMLKKHIRTHTDLRPYSCRHCAFAFKTKGNLTKHMKSKAHHKKCVELGIIPVPITIDESQIDCDALAKQEAIERSYSGGNLASDDDENDPDDDDGCEDDDDDGSDDEGVPIPIITSSGNVFTDYNKKCDLEVIANGEKKEKEARKSIIVANEIDEQEVARSLLVLSGSGEWSAATSSIDTSEAPGINTSPLFAPSKADSELRKPESVKPTDETNNNNNNSNSSQFFNPGTWTPNIATFSRQRSFSFNDGLIRNLPTMGHNPNDPQRPDRAQKAMKSPLFEPISTDDSNDSEVEDHFVRRYSMSVIQDRNSTIWRKPGLENILSEEGPIDLSKRTDDMDVSFDPNGNLRAGHSSSLQGLSRQDLSAYGGSLAGATTEGGKAICRTCNKSFSKLSQLRLHVNIHYLERPFRCDSCGVSFRTKGHLQKHERSGTHFNKVNINMTFGTPTTENPRPFKCDDCIIAFRIHGHLAKHLRSKAHIMKLECAGKLPCGMYADMERFGISLNEIDTNDCENSLQSLQLMAEKMYSKGGEVDLNWLKQSGTDGVSSANTSEESDKLKASLLSSSSSSSSSTFRITETQESSPPIQRSYSFSETSSHAPVKRLSTPDGSRYRPPIPLSNNFLSYTTSSLSSLKNDSPAQTVSASPMNHYSVNSSANLIGTVNYPHPIMTEPIITLGSGSLVMPAITSAIVTTSNESLSSSNLATNIITTNGNFNCSSQVPVVTSNGTPSLVNIDCNTIPVKPAITSGASNVTTVICQLQQSSSNYTNANVNPQPATTKPTITLENSSNSTNCLTPTACSYSSTTAATKATTNSPLVSTITSSTTNITSIRSNTCNYCNQVFKSAKFLQVHLYCDHQLQRSSSPGLANDNNNREVTTETETKHTCDICRKSFPDASILQKHFLSHSTPRPYVCDVCDAGFTSSSLLASHLPTHSVPQTQVRRLTENHDD